MERQVYETTNNINNNNSNNKDLNFKATELRLGLPGSESPEREVVLVAGAKRGFSDAIKGGSWKWALAGDDVDLVKHGGNKNHVQETGVVEKKKTQVSDKLNGQGSSSDPKEQLVGWPPIRSSRKNTMAVSHTKNEEGGDPKVGHDCLYVKVSMDGAPYLRKVDLKTYSCYVDLSSALEKMFSCFTIGQYGSHGVRMRDGLSESRLKDLLHASEYVLTYEDKDGDWMLVGDVPWDMFIASCKRMWITKSSDAIGLAPRVMEKSRNRTEQDNE